MKAKYSKLHAEELKLKAILAKNPPSQSPIAFPAIHDVSVRGKAGYEKIRYASNQAIVDGFRFLWADTCCIDKTSSAELSEAINSMFQWYQQASICYAYVEDVMLDDFNTSRWFTRGWTLQELLAPSQVYFYGTRWTTLGSKFDLANQISEVTGIDLDTLLSADRLRKKSIAQRMSWASRRQTTRLEDAAYCLLGIFGVNLPLLYGEGENSFIRLQEEIMRNSVDQSLFAWSIAQDPDDDGAGCGIFAPSPRNYQASSSMVTIQRKSDTAPYVMTNKGLQIQLPLVEVPGYVIGLLDCQTEHEIATCTGILLKRTHTSDVFVRVQSKNIGQSGENGDLLRNVTGGLLKVTHGQASAAIIRTVYLQKNAYEIPVKRSSYQVLFPSLLRREFQIVATRPSFDRPNVKWNPQTHLLHVVHDLQSRWQSSESIAFVFHHMKMKVAFAAYWYEHSSIRGQDRPVDVWLSPLVAEPAHKDYSSWYQSLSYGIDYGGVAYTRQNEIQYRHVGDDGNPAASIISASLNVENYFDQRVRVLSVNHRVRVLSVTSAAHNRRRDAIYGGEGFPEMGLHQSPVTLDGGSDVEEDLPDPLTSELLTLPDVPLPPSSIYYPQASRVYRESYSTKQVVPGRHETKSSRILPKLAMLLGRRR
jgi:Heterokaryon incompatibility protein (HET)